MKIFALFLLVLTFISISSAKKPQLSLDKPQEIEAVLKTILIKPFKDNKGSQLKLHTKRLDIDYAFVRFYKPTLNKSPLKAFSMSCIKYKTNLFKRPTCVDHKLKSIADAFCQSLGSYKKATLSSYKALSHSKLTLSSFIHEKNQWARLSTHSLLAPSYKVLLTESVTCYR